MSSVVDFPTIDETVHQALPGTDISAPVVPLNLVMNENRSHNMTLTLLNDKVLVSGSSTKSYKDNLRKLGGEWNKQMQVWQFESKHKQDVTDFLAGVTSGKIKPELVVGLHNGPHKSTYQHHNNSASSSATITLPTIGGGGGGIGNDSFFPVGPFKVFGPTVGMVAKIKINNQVIARTVVSVTGSREEGYSAYVTDPTSGNSERSKLETVGKHWQVRGLVPPHSIRFEFN